VNTVPQVIHFPVKGKPKRADTMDIYRFVIFVLIVQAADKHTYLYSRQS